MKRLELIGDDVVLNVYEKTLAVIANTKLKTLSSAIYQGGFTKTNTILNVEVPEGYNQQILHEKPELLVKDTAKEVGLPVKEAIGMITAAKIKQFSLVRERKKGVTVAAIVTAGCQFTESAGEPLEGELRTGTINTIVLFDGNPTDSCLASVLLTATEAKTAALNDLDLRSKYSGDLATGTITDSTVIASTDRGEEFRYAGPPSKLGNLVGYCVRKAVKKTVMRCDSLSPTRSIKKRLDERGLSIQKMVSELSKVKSLEGSPKKIKEKIELEITKNPISASFLMAAVKLDDEIKKGLIPEDFENIEALAREFREILRLRRKFKKPRVSKSKITPEELNSAELPPLLRQALIGLIERDSREKS